MSDESECVQDRFAVPETAAREIGPSWDADLHVDPLASPGYELETPAARWRVAKALERLRAQLNEAYPRRSKASDGTIGDAEHASRSSDHNPWVVDDGIGVVTAFDVTHDPTAGCDAGRIAEAFRTNRDPRIKYIIWDRKIANAQPLGGAPGWAWRTYSGKNPHNHHCHVSVRPDKAAYDDPRDWKIEESFVASTEGVASNGGGESARAALLEAALDALPGDSDRPLFERLVDAQDEIAALLSVYADQFRAKAIDTTEGRAPTFTELKPRYEALWESCAISPARAGSVTWHRGKLLRYKPRYEEVSAATGAPWWFIGIVHALEGSFNFHAHLHNGDPLDVRTVKVPRNRPEKWNPPTDWVSSAVDAITGEGYAGLADWNIARTLHRFEGYNGYGYYEKNISSPYLWSFSNHYSKGKFVSDGVYKPEAISEQCGAAVMLKALQKAGDVTL